MKEIAKIFVLIGIIFVTTGFLLYHNIKVPFFGKLPGDIVIKREHVTFYFPLTTCILLSLILSVIFLFFTRK
ncbi:DUF2905 domain-containing protein [Chlamydiota bacterium]